MGSGRFSKIISSISDRVFFGLVDMSSFGVSANQSVLKVVARGEVPRRYMRLTRLALPLARYAPYCIAHIVRH